MSRRVLRKVVRETDGNSNIDEQEVLDWTKLPDDTVITIFSRLNYRDRASLSSACRAWRALGNSPCLWQELDLGPHKFNASAASSLASRCQNLRKLRFRDSKFADAILNLQAKNLRKLSFLCCKKMTDAALCTLAARHKVLECLQIGGYFARRMTSVAINRIAICCPRLEKLWISGICEVDADTINALATNCKNLTDVGFINCGRVDENALGNLASIRFLSVAGIINIKWNLVVRQWSRLPNLVGLDVSRTNIRLDEVSGFFSSSYSLKVLCALCCPGLEEDVAISPNDNNREGKILLAVFTDILKGVAKLFNDTMPNNDGNIFLHWRNSKKDKKLGGLLKWLEWVISDSILRVSELDLCGLDDFWLNQGTTLLLSFLQSAQEDVQEKASTALATFATLLTTNGGNLSIHPRRAEAVIREGGIRLLLNVARSWREGLQSEAVKAISNLSLNANVAKAVVEEGGISILVNLAGSVSRYVAEEATGALQDLSFSKNLKCSIDEAFVVKPLVDLIYKWSKSTGAERVLEHVAGVLANLAADNRCCSDFAATGVVHALVSLTQTCQVKGVQEQAARALTNLASHEGADGYGSSVGQMSGALDALVQLTRSPYVRVRQEAASALWNSSYGDGNREAIAAAGGVEALVALASSCLNASRELQRSAAGALWGLSDSKEYSIAVVRGGGVAPLIALAQSYAAEVHETAAGALWTLASYPSNALHIMEEGGIHALGRLCSSSSSVSKRARFMSAMALAYMFDERIDEFAPSVGTSKSSGLDGHRRLAMKHIEAFVMTFSNPELFPDAAESLDPESVARINERARIKEIGHLKCSRLEIGRFVSILQNPSPGLKSCAAFALFQFTIPGGRFAVEHMNLLRDAGAPHVLRLHEGSPLEAKNFMRIILRNMEQHHTESSV